VFLYKINDSFKVWKTSYHSISTSEEVLGLDHFFLDTQLARLINHCYVGETQTDIKKL